MSNKKSKSGHKAAFPIGMIVVLLAAIGFVTVVVAGVKGVDTAIDKSRHFEEYEKFFTPVVLIDPDTFDDITKADMSQLMEISLWSLLKTDVAPASFENNDNGLAIPKAAVEEKFIDLFGTEITPVHGTIEGYAIDFTYDNASETYSVPLTGVTPIYTPDVIKVTKTTDTVVVTVACLAGDAWEQGENGEMIAPTPDKYIRITLRENNENLFISAIQNTTAPEVATTQGTGNGEIEDVNLIEQAELTETEPSTEQTTSEVESSTENTTVPEEPTAQ